MDAEYGWDREEHIKLPGLFYRFLYHTPIQRIRISGGSAQGSVLFQNSPHWFGNHPVWKLLPWGSCPCLSHGLDRGAYHNQDLICVWSDLRCKAGTRRYQTKGGDHERDMTGLLNNKNIWSSHSFNTYSLCTYYVPGAFLGDSSEQDRKVPAFQDMMFGQPSNQVNRTTSIYIKHIKSGIAHQYMLIDKLGPTLCYILCSLVQQHQNLFLCTFPRFLWLQIGKILQFFSVYVISLLLGFVYASGAC